MEESELGRPPAGRRGIGVETPSRNRRGVAAVTKGRGRQAGQSPGGASTMEAEPSNKGIDEDLRRGAHPGAAGRSGTTAPEASHRTVDENGEKGRGGKNLGERRDLGVWIWIRGSGETSHHRRPPRDGLLERQRGAQGAAGWFLSVAAQTPQSRLGATRRRLGFPRFHF
jgi:hypothetical protein